MKKENLKDEKIQTNVAEEVKSEDLQKCSEQNTKEESHEPAWRTRALEFLDVKINNEKTVLISYQYSRLVAKKWSPFVPYSSYSHFSSSKPDIKSIILGSLEYLEVGTYLFKLIGIWVYRTCWHPSNFSSNSIDTWNTLKLNVFSAIKFLLYIPWSPLVEETEVEVLLTLDLLGAKRERIYSKVIIYYLNKSGLLSTAFRAGKQSDLR